MEKTYLLHLCFGNFSYDAPLIDIYLIHWIRMQFYLNLFVAQILLMLILKQYCRLASMVWFLSLRNDT